MTNFTHFGTLLIMLSVLAANLGLILVRKRIKSHDLKDSHEVGGYLFAALATLYAVLLGLIVVDAMGKFQEATHQTESESNSVSNIFLLAEQFPNDKKTEIQLLCRKYAQLVVSQEWQAMDDERYDPEARATGLNLMKSVIGIVPTTDAQNSVYQTALNEACQFWAARRCRIVTATHGIPDLEMFVVVVGGIVTVVFTYFFGIANFKVQAVMTSMVAFIISLNIFLFCMYGEPFRGAIRIKPDSFTSDLRIFEGNLSSKALPNNPQIQ